MFPIPLTPLRMAANALLEREPWAARQLQDHTGKVVVLHIDAQHYACRIDARGQLVEASANAVAAVQVRVDASQLLRLLRAPPNERLQAIRIEGEAGLTQTLSVLATHLRPDLEDELARWVGDVAARRLLQLGQVGWQQLSQRVRALHENLAEYAVHEAGHLPLRPDVEQWQRHVHALDERTRQLLNRAAALQAKTRPPS